MQKAFSYKKPVAKAMHKGIIKLNNSKTIMILTSVTNVTCGFKSILYSAIFTKLWLGLSSNGNGSGSAKEPESEESSTQNH